jgi:hypothetical protein
MFPMEGSPMSITLSIDEEQKFFLEIWEGHIEAADACAAIDEAVKDPRYCPGMAGMVDMRRAVIEFGDEGIDAIFRKKREYGSLHTGWRWALLAATTDQIATCALYVSRTDNTPIEISTFQDEDEAMRWLEVTAPARL